MTRKHVSITPVVAFALLCPCISYANPTAVRGLVPAGKGDSKLVYLFCPGGEGRTLALRKKLIAAGAVRVNCFLPDRLAAEVPAGIDVGELAAGEGALWMWADDEAGPAELRWLKDCYRGVQTLGRAKIRAGSFRDTVLVVPPALRREEWMRLLSSADPPERLPGQGSEFMVGDIVVQIVLPESEGPSENWTDRAIAEVVQGVAQAMISFQASFSYVPMNFVFKSYPRVPTAYEPIDHNMESDYLWIEDVLLRLGYGASGMHAITAAHLFNEEARQTYGADWAFCAFVANSANDPDHLFRGGSYTAYALLGGPYLVVPYPAGSNPYGIDQVLLFSQVAQHEAGHVFWALDEYFMAPAGCHELSGYLAVPNMNKIMGYDGNGDPVGCRQVVPCIMARAKEDLGRPVCSYTAGQMGLADGDDNNIPDVFDRPPSLIFEGAAQETIFTSAYSFRCRALSRAVPNRNPFQSPEERRDYAPVLRKGFFDVGGVGGAPFYPEDGSWDEVDEDVVIKAPSLPTGLTRLRVKVITEIGLDSGWQIKEVFRVGLSFSPFRVEITEGGIGLAWDMVGETFGASFRLVRIDGESGDTLSAAVEPVAEESGGFLPFAYFDEEVEPGRTYCYYVVGSFSLGRGRASRRYSFSSARLRVTAMLPIERGRIISACSPNPFHSRTTFSLRIPVRYRETSRNPQAPGFGSWAGPSFLPAYRVETPSLVKVGVFDAAGREVRRIFQGELFAGVATFHWDGSSEGGAPVSSGVYFLRAEVGGEVEVKKVVLVR